MEGETLPSAVENHVWFAQTVLLCIAFYLYVSDCTLHIDVINNNVILQGQFNENGCTTIWLNDVNSIQYTLQ